MAELCPDAWLLNYTNPMAMLCWATYAGTPQKRIVGLCHSVQNTTRAARRATSASRSRRSPSSAPASTTRRSSCASSATARTSTRCLDEAIERDPELLRRVRVRDVPAARLLPDRVERALGRVPAVADARRRGDRALPAAGSASTSRAARRTWPSTSAPASCSPPGEPLELEPSNEYAPQIIHSIETGTAAGDLRQRPQHGPDRRTFPPTPASRCPCLVDGAGVQPTCGRRAAAAAGGAQPDLPERRRAHRPGRARGPARVRQTGGDARPERRGDASRSTRSGSCATSSPPPTEMPCPRRLRAGAHEQGGEDRVETDEDVRGAGWRWRPRSRSPPAEAATTRAATPPPRAAASRSRSSSGTARRRGSAELLQDDDRRVQPHATPTSSSRRTPAGSTPTGCCRR